MSLNKRKLLTLHRWLGLLSAFFLIILSITGLALNHTERLGLDSIQVKTPLLSKLYGMQSSGDIQSYRIQETNTISHVGGQLYYNTKALVSAAQPLALYPNTAFTVIVCPTSLILLSDQGELIEQIKIANLPFKTITAAGRNADAQIILVTESGLWVPDANWLKFSPYNHAYQVDPLLEIDLAQNTAAEILAHHQGQGLSLYRVLLDLHAGRLFGWGGRTLMDLTAIAILFLITSGLSSWFMKSRRA
jgi:hypothetical protein